MASLQAKIDLQMITCCRYMQYLQQCNLILHA